MGTDENLVAAAKLHREAKIRSATEIAAARENLKALEKSLKSAENNAKIARDLAIRAAFDSGMSVSAICRSIDTSNRATVYAVLERLGASQAEPEKPLVQEGDYVLTSVQTTALGVPGYLVTWPDGVTLELSESKLPLGPKDSEGRMRWVA